jgi:hypothetical protein
MQTTKEKLKWLKVDNQSFVLIINVLFFMLIIMLVLNFHTKKMIEKILNNWALYSQNPYNFCIMHHFIFCLLIFDYRWNVIYIVFEIFLVIKSYEDPLKWWKANQVQFPTTR